MADFQSQSDNLPINYASAFNTYYTYSFINNSQFYALVPPAYVDFYRRFVRQWFYWYDGYVPHFHNQNSGIFSTRLATTIIRKMASHINGGQLMLDEDEPTENKSSLKFAQKWADKVDLSNKTDTAIEYALAGGTSLYKLNSTGKNLWVEPMRLDNYFADVDWSGQVNKFTGFIHSYTKTIRDNETNHIYYLLEERYFKQGEWNNSTMEFDEIPYVKYVVKRSTQNITTARSFEMTDIHTVEWNSIPKNIRKSIKRDYGVIRIDQEQKLPFKNTLGCYLMKATNHISNLPGLQFGESMMSTMVSYLMSYDYYFSAMNTNMYLGRSRVMMPKPLQNPNNNKRLNYNDGFDSFMYTKMTYGDGKDNKITPLQFDLRENSWNKIRNIILEGCATSIGINASTLASYLGGAGEKTAREISAEEGSTNLYVQNKRTLFSKPLNAMLDTVMEFYNKKQNVVVKFSKAGLSNMRNLAEISQVLMASGLMDKLTGLEFVYHDKSPDQIETIKKRIEEEEEKKREFESEKQEQARMNQETKLSRTDNDNRTSDDDNEQEPTDEE